jgi:DNA-binding protein YbaB
LSSTANSISRKARVLESQIYETNQLLDIAGRIQSGRYDERSAALREDASARISAAISAYTTAAKNTPSVSEDEEQLVNTSITYDPNNTDDAVIVTIRATSSPEDAGIKEDLFDESAYSIEETITALKDAKSRFEAERAALGSTGTAVAAGDEDAQQRAAAIAASSDSEEHSDLSDVIREQLDKILAEANGSDASIASSLASLIEGSTPK